MRRTIGTLSLTAMSIIGLAVGSYAAAQPASVNQVRGMSRMATGLLDEAIARSRTIRGLVDELERSDLIVRVHTRLGLRDVGQTSFVTATGTFRYVDVAVDFSLDPRRRFEMLGHELQHAAEIARERTVRDQTTLRAYMKRIGRQVGTRDAFDTDAACRTEYLVRNDLHAR